jgi:two-component system, LytTR family, response regulator
MTPKLKHGESSGLRSGGADRAQAAKNVDTRSEGWDEFIPADDFALLQDKADCWMIRVSAISTLEACGNYTRVHQNSATPLVRRPLRECERKLDPSLFFRARADCIVNLGRVSHTRTLVPFQLVFVLQDRREIVASREHSLRFRSRAL